MVPWGRADLHTHTTASDGWPTPAQLVDHASRRAALNVIAVTDHDTIEGALRAADLAAKRRRIHVVPRRPSTRSTIRVGLRLRCIRSGVQRAR